MEKIKILLTRSLLGPDLEYIKAGLDRRIRGCYEIVIPNSFDEAGICKHVEDADVLLGPYVTKKILENAHKLKLVQIPWTGMDTFDFSAVDGSVPVCNTHSNADAVAELGVALLLDLLKKVSYHDQRMRKGDWNRKQQQVSLKSKMISKQKVCILGYGNIGKRMAKVLHAFGASIVAVSSKQQQEEMLLEVYSHDQTKKAISDADVVIVTVPLTHATRNMINAKMIQCMKKSVVILNMSRADILDEDAIYNGLLDGHIGAFGADVWWNTPKRGESQSYPSEKNDFTQMPNVVFSPHRAGFIEGALPHLDGAIENISNLVEGKPLTCIVDINKCY